MNELIKIQTKGDQQLVSARELHKGLGLKKKFTDWVKQNFKGFEEGQDYTTSPKSHLVKSGNGTVRVYDDYLLTIDMAKELCMMSKTEKGRKSENTLFKLKRSGIAQKKLLRGAINYFKTKIYSLRLKTENSLKLTPSKLKRLIETLTMSFSHMQLDTATMQSKSESWQLF